MLRDGDLKQPIKISAVVLACIILVYNAYVLLPLLRQKREINSSRTAALLMPTEAGSSDFQLPERFITNIKKKKATESFIITPRNLLRNASYFMLFIVKSTTTSFDRRMLVRRTYGALQTINKQNYKSPTVGAKLSDDCTCVNPLGFLIHWNKHEYHILLSFQITNKQKFFTLFLVGRSCSEGTQDRLLKESKANGDILQVDTDDSYSGLPSKVLASYQWLYYHHGDVATFYATTDDDCLINVASVYSYFSTNTVQLKTSNSMFCAFQYSNHLVPNRDENSKYFVSREVYPDAQFPHFCHGGLTVMSFPILSDIYRLAEITNRTGMVLEDVLINGILRYKLGKKNSNIKRVIQPRLGPMLWHLSNADELHFKLAWSAVTTLLTIRVHNRTRYFGLFPSARIFLADMNDAVLPMLH